MYNLIYKSGEIKELTDDQALTLINAKTLGKDSYILEGAMKSFSKVSEIVPIRNVPAARNQLLASPKMNPWTKEKKIKALKSIRNGFMKGIKYKKELSSGQRVMIKRMENNIKRAEKIETTHTAPIKSVASVYGGL